MIETKESERESCSWFTRRSTQKSLPDQSDLIWCAFTKFNVQLLPRWMHFQINNQMSRTHYSKFTKALTIQINSINFPNSLGIGVTKTCSKIFLEVMIPVPFISPLRGVMGALHECNEDLWHDPFPIAVFLDPLRLVPISRYVFDK